MEDIQCGQEINSCVNSICQYFRWFYPFHYKQCPSSPLHGKKRGVCVGVSKVVSIGPFISFPQSMLILDLYF